MTAHSSYATWTPAQDALLRAGWEALAPVTVTATNCGRSTEATRHRAKQLGLAWSPSPVRPAWVAADDDRLRRLTDEGNSRTVIGGELGRTPKAVKLRQSRLGIVQSDTRRLLGLPRRPRARPAARVAPPGELTPAQIEADRRLDETDTMRLAVFFAAPGKTALETVSALPYPAAYTLDTLDEYVRKGLLGDADGRFVKLSDHDSKRRIRGRRVDGSPRKMPKRPGSGRRAMEAA